MKRLKHLFTAILLLCGVVANAHDFISNGICYYFCTLEDGKTSVGVTYHSDYKYSDYWYSGDIVIPEKVTYDGNTYDVVIIGDYAFYSTRITSITIPSSIKRWGTGVFSHCSNLKKVVVNTGSIIARMFDGIEDYIEEVVIGDYTKKIDYGTFYSCTNLKSITIGSGVTSIATAFDAYCENLSAVHVNNLSSWCNITFDSESANPLYYAQNLYLNGNLLTDLVIPDGVSEIKDYTFSNCSALTNVIIPNSVKNIGQDAFSGCNNIKTVINFSECNINLNNVNIVNAPNGSIYGDFIFGKPNGVNTLLAYTGNPTNIVLAQSYYGERYEIGRNVFKNNTTLTSIEIPSSVTNIGEDAFFGCINLKTVINYSNLTLTAGSNNNGYVAYYAEIVGTPIKQTNEFKDNNLYCIHTKRGSWAIENGGNALISNNSLGSPINSNDTRQQFAIIKNNGKFYLYHPAEKKFVRKDGSLSSYAVDEIHLKNGAYNNTFVVYFNDSHYININNGSNITIDKWNTPDDGNSCTIFVVGTFEVPEIGDNNIVGDFVFVTDDGNYYLTEYLGNDTHIVLPDKFNNKGYSIGADVFKNRNNIVSVTVGTNVEDIDDTAFYGCENIAKVFWLPNTPPEGYRYLNGKINYVSNNNYTNLSNTVVTSFLSSKFEMDGMVFIPTSISERKCCIVDDINNNIVDLVIKDTVLYKNVALAVSEIMPYSFYNNNAITSINIPKSITSVGDYAFKGCSRLTTAKIADRTDILPLGRRIFDNSALQNLYIGAKISYINEIGEDDASPFCKNNTLKKVVITDIEDQIYDYEFYNCSALESVTVGDGVESIGKWAFSGCGNLAEFVFGSNVSSIGEEAFSDCIKMTKITGRAILPPACGSQALDDIDKWKCNLYVPSRNLSQYQNAEQWKEFPFIEDLETNDNYVTYMIDDEVYKTLLLTPGKRIIAPYVADRDGKAFSGWNMEEYMTIPNPSSKPANSSSARTANTVKTAIDIAGNANAMLYTNAPCTVTTWGDEFKTWNVLFDNDVTTMFHSEYADTDTPDGLDHYIRVDMGEGNTVGVFEFTYTTREANGNTLGVCPRTVIVEGSNYADGEYEEIATLTNLPQASTTVYTSEELGSNDTRYRYIRFRVTQNYSGQNAMGHPYFAITEFGMSKIELESIEPEPEPDFEPEFGLDERVPIMPDRDITIYGSFTTNSYTVKYIIDGEIHRTYTVESGKLIPFVEAPQKEGYTFSGWSKIPETMPAKDVEITGSFNINSYTLTYMLDGETFRISTLNYGDRITPLDEPQKEGYTFSGWSEIPETMPAHNVIIIGSFTLDFSETIPVTSITLNKESATLVVGETTILVATVSPVDATDKNVVWTSSNKDVAIVENGVVTAITAGTTTIIASAGGKLAICNITVSEKDIAVTGIALDITATTITEGERIILTPVITPVNATCNNISWTTSNTSVATVEDGIVTAVAPGTATIILSIDSYLAFCNVTVVEKGIAITGVTFNVKDVTVGIGEGTKIIPTVTPADATGYTITWESSNPEIATVEESGIVTGLSAGRTTITATIGEHSATYVVNVLDIAQMIESAVDFGNTDNYTIYHISQPYHSKGMTSWAVAEGGNALKSNVDLNINIALDDPRQQFAIIDTLGATGLLVYLYCVGEKKFVNKDGSLSEKPVDIIRHSVGAFEKTGTIWFDNAHYINVGGSRQMLIDGWGVADGGNSCIFVPVGAFDPTEALEAFNDTAVEDIEAEDEKSQTVYDLKGNRILDVENLERGIYIINGNKILVK